MDKRIMPAVMLVTAGAARADDLSEQDYREIYDELRSKRPLRQFAEAIHSAVSFAWWSKYESKYERGEATLTRPRRAELRAAVGLPALPPAVGEALAGVDPDAAVWRVGAGTADRVVLVGSETHEPLDLRLNGSLQILGEEAAQDAGVTGVTAARPRAARGTVHLCREAWERLNAARLARGVGWEEFLMDEDFLMAKQEAV